MLLGARRRASVDERDAMVSLGSAMPEASRLTPVMRHGLSIFSLAFLVGENQAVLPGNALAAGLLIERLLFDTDWGEQDYLILDLPPGTGEPQATLVSRVSVGGVVLVMTPQNTAILDTLRSYHMFRQAGVPIVGRIENMSYLVCPHCGEGIDMASTDAFAGSPLTAVPLLGRLPFDPSVGRATNSGRPVVISDPDSVASTVFERVAIEIDTILGGRETGDAQ